MKIKRALLFLPILLLLAFVPGNEDPIDRVINALSYWAKINPVEKVYLHTDKPYYALGDTIWFKGYVTIGSRHQLSAKSGALYVDLINEQDSILRTLKLPVNAGTTQGDFAIKDEWQEGVYRIRAYTQWMRNAGDDYFYDQTFTIGSLATLVGGSSSSNGSKNSSAQNDRKKKDVKDAPAYDIQFFPEGG
ncbi:MAG: TonB-dependent receptor, partial [Pedobacter sp.]